MHTHVLPSGRMIIDTARAETANTGSSSEIAVEAHGLSKTYLPSPWWMRCRLKTAIREPVRPLTDVSLNPEAGQICAIRLGVLAGN